MAAYIHELTANLQVGLLPPGNHSQVKLSVQSPIPHAV
jgi:hypothetical protein